MSKVLWERVASLPNTYLYTVIASIVVVDVILNRRESFLSVVWNVKLKRCGRVHTCTRVFYAADFGSSSLERLGRQQAAPGRAGRLEPIEERVIPIQRRTDPQLQQQQQQQVDASTSDIRRHYAVYRRRASNVEPSLSTLSSLPAASCSHAVIVGGGGGGDDVGAAAAAGFCVSVGRHSRGFSLSLRPQQQTRPSPLADQRPPPPLVSVVIPNVASDASPRQPSPRQPSPSNSGGEVYRSAEDQPGRYTIYQPLLATGGTSATQQLYDLPRRRLLLPPSASSQSGLHPIISFLSGSSRCG